MSIEVRQAQDTKAIWARAFAWLVRLPRMSWYVGLTLFLLGYLALGVLALGFISFGTPPISEVQRAEVSTAVVFGRALLVAGCSFTVAALVGFLFGVPRSPRRPDQNPASASYSSTNLEEISDWLTKILIGAALVSLPTVPAFLGQLDLVIDPGAGRPGSAGFRGIGALVAAYFSLGGVILGYTQARIFVQSLYRSPLLDEAIKLSLSVPISPRRGQGARLTLNDVEAIDTLATTDHALMRNESERRAWARAQILSDRGDQKAAVNVYRDLARTSTNPSVFSELAEVLDLTGDADGAARYRKEADIKIQDGSGELAPDAAINRMFHALYEEGGFDEAIKIGEDLSQRIQNDRLWVYLACAYGQRHASLLQRHGLSQEVERARERALFCAKQAVDLAPSWRPILRSMWDRNAIRPGDDDDLASFYGDDRFRALLDPDSIVATQSASFPETLTRYSGHVAFHVTTKSGSDLSRNKDGEFLTEPGAACRVVLRFVPGRFEADDLKLPLEVVGEERREAVFELQPESSDVQFRPSRMAIVAMASEATHEIDFGFDAPTEDGGYEMWIEVVQARRTVQMVTIRLRIASGVRLAST